MRVRSAWLIEGVRLEDPLDLPPFRILPVSLDRGYIGADGRGILNAGLQEAGFVTVIERSSWGMQIAPRRRLALAVSHPTDVDGVAESLILGRLASRAADALTLSHGGAPRLVGGVTEISDDGSTWRTIAVQVGSGQWPGSALEKLASSVQPLDIETAAAPPRPSYGIACVATGTWAQLRAWLKAPEQASMFDLLGGGA